MTGRADWGSALVSGEGEEGSTEEELQEFMDQHEAILVAADECEQLRDAGEALTEAFSSQPQEVLFGELLRLCRGVVQAADAQGGGGRRLEDVAQEALERAHKQQRLAGGGVGGGGTLTEMFQDTCISYHNEERAAAPQGEDVEVMVVNTHRRPQARPAGAVPRERRGEGFFSGFFEALEGGGGRRPVAAQRRPLVADGELVERLVGMGFTRTAAESSLVECDNDSAKAVQLLTTIKVDEELVAQLVGLGFNLGQVRKALHMCNNDAALALEKLTASYDGALFFGEAEEDSGFTIVSAADV